MAEDIGIFFGNLAVYSGQAFSCMFQGCNQFILGLLPQHPHKMDSHIIQHPLRAARSAYIYLWTVNLKLKIGLIFQYNNATYYCHFLLCMCQTWKLCNAHSLLIVFIRLH
jgi:hypothetical protein